MSFSPDGSCVVIYNTWNNHSKFEPSDIYLLDFDNSEIWLLGEKPENLDIKLLPKNIRDSFDPENIGWNIDFKNLDKLDYNIESEYDPDIGTIWYAIDKEEQKNEITALRNSHNASEPPIYIVFYKSYMKIRHCLNYQNLLMRAILCLFVPMRYRNVMQYLNELQEIYSK